MLDERAAWYVASILAGAPGPDHVSPGTIAFKTGTSYGYRDAWAIGFDGRHVIGVWVGRPDGAPVPGLIGVDAAAPILMDAFARLGGDDAAPRRAARHRRGDRREPAAAAPPLPLAERSRASPQPRRPRSPIRRAACASISASRDGDPMPLVLKARDGAPPYTWFVDGAPIGTAVVRRRAVLGAARAGLRRPHGDRRARRVGDEHGVSGVAGRSSRSAKARTAPCTVDIAERVGTLRLAHPTQCRRSIFPLEEDRRGSSRPRAQTPARAFTSLVMSRSMVTRLDSAVAPCCTPI